MKDQRILPTDFGARHAVRFYLTRFALLGAAILLAALIPLGVVLLHRGVSTVGVVVAVLLLLGWVVRSSIGESGVLSPALLARLHHDAEPELAATFGTPRWLDFLRLVPGMPVVLRVIALLARMLRAR
ncbi:MAG: hypothetical protein ACJ74U_17190 [Jatrophihabitantaceae bacterium]